MSVQVEQLIASLALIEAQTAESAYPFLIILREPEADEIEIAQDSLISFVLVQLDEDPSSTAPYTLNCSVEISLDGGETWQDAYVNGAFSAPFDGGSSGIVYHSPTDPYVYNAISIDYTGDFDDSSTVMVRAAASVIGWGHFPWEHSPWGHPEAVGTYTEEWSFVVVDLTAPKLISAEAIDRKTIRLTFDDDMRASTPDGRALLQTGIAGPWNLSTGGEILSVSVDGGQVQEITFETFMWLDPSVVTSEEMATALSALVSGGIAEDDGAGGVYLRSQTSGDSSSLRVSGGTANTILGFPTEQSTGTSEGVLDVENYTIERHNVYPEVAVHLTVESVEFVEDSLSDVDMVCQWEMTPGAPYEIIVDDDIADTSNNMIDPDFVSVDFLGFEPEWPDDRDTEITFPRGVWDGDPLRVFRATVNMAQEIEDQHVTDIDELWDVWNVDTTGDPTIELMLYDAGNPFYALNLNADQKRKLVDLLPYIYQQKGLPGGLTSTILALLEIPVRLVPYAAESWRLGVNRLGSSYPARLWSSNSETYVLTGGGTLGIKIDGGNEQIITFSDDDFVDPAAAKAEEVAIVIHDQLEGGDANIFDDGGGVRLEIFSSTWGPGGSIQVSGGTFAAIIGFDTAIESGSGGCLLGPSTERALRTFDLEYSDVIPSEEEIVQMTHIANYMKAVNNHLGKIRPAKTIPAQEYWILGFDELGVDTVLGS